MPFMDPNRSSNLPIQATVDPDVSALTVRAFRRFAVPARGLTYLIAIAVLAWGAVRAQPADDRIALVRGPEIGAVDFGADCGIEVVDRIDQALGLMYYMMYEQSQTVFAGIGEEEPSCAMALVEATGAFFTDPESADAWTRIERWAHGGRLQGQSWPILATCAGTTS